MADYVTNSSSTSHTLWQTFINLISRYKVETLSEKHLPLADDKKNAAVQLEPIDQCPKFLRSTHQNRSSALWKEPLVVKTEDRPDYVLKQEGAQCIPTAIANALIAKRTLSKQEAKELINKLYLKVIQQDWNKGYDGRSLDGYINPHQLVSGRIPGISLRWIDAQEAMVSQKPLLVFDRLLFNGHVMYAHKVDTEKRQVTLVETINGTLVNYPIDEVPLHILKAGPYKGQPRTVCGQDDPRQYFLEIENIDLTTLNKWLESH